MSRYERIEMLAIGDELLDGRVTDTNTVCLGRALTGLGLTLAQRTTVADDIEAIVRAARAAIARKAGLVVVSGGLGPTMDDITAEAFAAVAGVDLVRDEEQVRAIEERLRSRGRAVADNQLKQADRPEGSEVISNPRGTAPGFSLVHDGCRFVALPGVPHEFEYLLRTTVIAELGADGPQIVEATLYTFGLVEGDVDALLQHVRRKHADVRFGFRAKFPEIHVSFKVEASRQTELEAAVVAARKELGAHVYADVPISMAEVVLNLLRNEGATLAVAESCTGGLVADNLTDVAGSSDVFCAGVVSYANTAKEKLLGVAAETLATVGAVSENTVMQMANGVREQAGTTYGLSTSGIAGPGGGTADKPVGTIWIGAVGPSLAVARKLSLPFDRRGNKVVTAYAVLDLLRRALLTNAT